MNFLKTGAFGDRIPLDFTDLIAMYGQPDEIFSNAKSFLDSDEVDEFLAFKGVDMSDPDSFPIVAGYGDIQFHFHHDQPSLVVCNYSSNYIPESNHFNLSNACLLKGNTRLAKFLEKMAKHCIEISDISLRVDKITRTRFLSVTTASGVKLSFHHEDGARDFRLSQFTKSNEL